MKWQPKICKITQQNIIPPEYDNITKKLGMVQEHNKPNITTETEHTKIYTNDTWENNKRQQNGDKR